MARSTAKFTFLHICMYVCMCVSALPLHSALKHVDATVRYKSLNALSVACFLMFGKVSLCELEVSAAQYLRAP